LEVNGTDNFNAKGAAYAFGGQNWEKLLYQQDKDGSGSLTEAELIDGYRAFEARVS